MPALRAAVRGGVIQPGGVWRYPLGRLYEEVAYIAFHFHWPHDDIMTLEHSARRKWVEEIARINRRLSEGGGESPRL
ncbi:MAG TPA: DUF6760 family protein [Pyrinomonadaceae bacterium]